MIQYVIYFNPFDFPGLYVCRPWLITAGAMTPMRFACIAATIEELRWPFERLGLYRLDRHRDDDVSIVEIWF